MGTRIIGGNKPLNLTGSRIQLQGTISNKTGANLIVHMVQIQYSAALNFDQAFTGMPIMREGFMTETGLLSTSSEGESHNLVSFI